MQVNIITHSTINNFSIASKNNSHLHRKTSVFTKEQLEKLDKEILIQLLLQLDQDYNQTQQQVQGLQEENHYLKKELKKSQENIEELLTFNSNNINLEFHSASSNSSLSNTCDSFMIKNRNPPSISKSSSKRSLLQERKEKYYQLPVSIQRPIKKLKDWFLKQREKQSKKKYSSFLSLTISDCISILNVSYKTAKKYLLLFLDIFKSVVQLYQRGSRGRGHKLTLSLNEKNIYDF